MTTWRKYGSKPEVGAVSLRSSSTGIKEIYNKGEIVNLYKLVRPNQVFLYQAATFFCSSPNPNHWTNFIKENKNEFGPCPSNFDCSNFFKEINSKQGNGDSSHYKETEVELYWLRYFDQKYLFVAYLADERTMAVDHREKGRTYDNSVGAPKNNEIVQHWSERWESNLMPSLPLTLDIRLQEVSNYKVQAVQMSKQNGLAVLNIVEGVYKIQNYEFIIVKFQKFPVIGQKIFHQTRLQSC